LPFLNPGGDARLDQTLSGAVAVEGHGNAFAPAGFGGVLEVDVQVRLAGVAGVAHAGDRLASGDAVAGLDSDRTRLEVTEEQVFALGDLEDDVVPAGVGAAA
jgi:hypothetical protein